MRDIFDYENKYMDLPFEKYQVGFRRKNIIDSLSLYKHNNILEIGCGLEPLFKYYDNYNKYFIVEPCELFYNNAVKLSSKKNVVCIKGFFEEVADKLLNEKIDYIILSSLLHEVEDPLQLLNSIYNICSRDTIVYVNVPNAKSFHRLLAKEMGIIGSIYQKSDTQKLMQQSNTYDLDLLIKEVNRANFRVLNSGSYFIKPFTHSQMQSCLDENIFDNKLLDGLDRLIKYMPEYGSEIFVQACIDEDKVCK